MGWLLDGSKSTGGLVRNQDTDIHISHEDAERSQPSSSQGGRASEETNLANTLVSDFWLLEL